MMSAAVVVDGQKLEVGRRFDLHDGRHAVALGPAPRPPRASDIIWEGALEVAGAAASGRGGTTSHRRVSLSRYYLELMASFTAMTVLDRVREKVVGGGTEVGHDCEHTMHPNAVS